MRTSNAHGEPKAKAPSRSTGFSLVELLVVIAIIGVIVSLLVPGLSYAKIQAKAARTRTIIQAIEAGLEMFYNDSNVGGDYPPSAWDTRDPGKTHPWGGSGFKTFGAQTLVWALIGPDKLGSAGFKTNDLEALYDLKGPGPKATRADILFSRADEYIHGLGRLGINVSDRGSSEMPAVIDDFGMPILYFKADPRAAVADRYNLADNQGFKNVPGPDRGVVHPLWNDQYITADATNSQVPATADINSYFRCYIWNSKIEMAYQPANPDEYLLISAGPDKLYGTVDDITNFPLVDGKNHDRGLLPK